MCVDLTLGPTARVQLFALQLNARPRGRIATLAMCRDGDRAMCTMDPHAQKNEARKPPISFLQDRHHFRETMRKQVPADFNI